LARAAEPTCPTCAEWNRPQAPFKIFGSSYYVGVHGLSAVLITSDNGHVLIDGGSRESAPQIAASIRTLGFRVEDVRLILNSHAHFDHAGGIAELQRLSHALAASAWNASVLEFGAPGRGDPQFATTTPIDRVANVITVAAGETMQIGAITMTAHLTPGHTPGGTTWSWQSCENTRCLNLVYADSLTAVSDDGFRFTTSAEYPTALADFAKSFNVLESVRCDILLLPHPEFSDIFGKLARRERRTADAFVDPDACRRYATTSRQRACRTASYANGPASSRAATSLPLRAYCSECRFLAVAESPDSRDLLGIWSVESAVQPTSRGIFHGIGCLGCRSRVCVRVDETDGRPVGAFRDPPDDSDLVPWCNLV
jgi:metallo-beta-lactamase class B